LNDEGKEISKKEYFEMKKKVRELELENEILKKATAIFAKKV
jgi:transposase